MKSSVGLVVSSFLGLALHASAQQAGTQNPFGAVSNDALNGAGSTGSQASPCGSQNPFCNPGSQNPSGGNPSTGGGTNPGGSQNPFPGSGSNPGGSTGSRLDEPGCPATRAVAPAGQALTYASSPICPTGNALLSLGMGHELAS
jgi:hypothetical protein